RTAPGKAIKEMKFCFTAGGSWMSINSEIIMDWSERFRALTLAKHAQIRKLIIEASSITDQENVFHLP
ncbi:hypothetical protein PFISCL1PPCAC_28339, partial [Pristionchus fissidentatus]